MVKSLLNKRENKRMSLSFHKLNREVNERRYSGPEGRVEFKKLSLRMRNAVRDIYKMIDRTPDPIVGKIDGFIKMAANKHDVKVVDIENYFDKEVIK